MRSPEPPDEGRARRAKRLLEVALESDGTFGAYDLLERIGEGGTGDVHRARRVADGQIVALKIMRHAYKATLAERQRFLTSAALAQLLNHPHIVRVLDFGDHEGIPFVAMTLVEGASLSETPPRAPGEAVRWMVAISRAIQHAHEQGISHRDLKPANILIDEQREPHVVDFGLARRLDKELTRSRGALVGTLLYMAPEQASGDARPLPSADVYSLGAILYQLLTGRPPITGDPVETFLDNLRRVDPVPPHLLNPAISAALENVCLRSLEKDPRHRYARAEDLADDLERAGRGVATEARPLSLWRRVRRFARRHPRASRSVSAIGAGALLATTLTALQWRLHVRAEARELETNAFIATGQAGAALFQLRTYADRVEQAARAPALRRLLEKGERLYDARDLAPLAKDFDDFFVQSIEAGRIIAQWPPPNPVVYERTYDFRDYFRGARRLAEAGAPGVYLSRAYRSEAHDRVSFALSVPVLDPRGVPLGILVASINAKAAFGAVRMEHGSADGDRITTALLGPRDRDRSETGEARLPSDFAFLVHPGLRPGVGYSLQAPTPAQLQAAFGPPAAPGEQFALQYVPPLKTRDHRDVVPGFDGAWLAAFAPVGKTGYVVMVRTPRVAFFRWPRMVLHALSGRAGLALATVLSLLAAGAILRGRRRARRLDSPAFR